jgi:hypothetical protein
MTWLRAIGEETARLPLADVAPRNYRVATGRSVSMIASEAFEMDHQQVYDRRVARACSCLASRIEDNHTLIPEDQPTQLSAQLRAFMSRSRGSC